MWPAFLDRYSGVPLYYQIQQHLLEQIRSGTWKAGSLFLPNRRSRN